jgi:hypothetical protein
VQGNLRVFEGNPGVLGFRGYRVTFRYSRVTSRYEPYRVSCPGGPIISPGNLHVVQGNPGVLRPCGSGWEQSLG